MRIWQKKSKYLLMQSLPIRYRKEKDTWYQSLEEVFDSWYDQKLKTEIYPQYQDVLTIKAEEIKAIPKGTAYERLQKMVGITQIKAVIEKALNYNKLQKIYREKGIKTGRPVMHMVFTGNPGTAKTTVARLLAQIMQDNGLLSKRTSGGSWKI